MIVKNEEKNIRRALSWGKDIMCEQIVVDTGSSDRTVEIAREMGAKIFSFPWINDFAAAKNFAIDQAKGGCSEDSGDIGICWRRCRRPSYRDRRSG